MSYTYKLTAKSANVEVKINPVWGSITGNIADQKDLKSKLDAIPDTSNLATKEELDMKANKTDIYTKTEIENKNYLTAETDPTVPEWAKQPTKPTYTAKEVGALPADTEIPNISGLATKEEIASKLDISVYNSDKATFETKGNAAATYQPKGDYALKSDLSGKADTSAIVDMLTKTEASTTYATKAELGDINTVLDNINGE